MMDKLKLDLLHIKWGLLAMLLALAAGGTAAVLSQKFVGDAQQAHRQAESRLHDAMRNLEAATDDQQNMAAYAQEYSMLLKRNVIGNEQRLDWIDGLERLRQRGIVQGFKYTIAPQQPYKPPVALDAGNFDFYRSDMTLSFELLHEGQLVNFFNALRSNVKGWYMLDGCNIERTERPAENLPGAAPQLTAECKGGWLTLKNRNAK